MQTLSIGDARLEFESAEAGTRYHAPILILPGLFQSNACWCGIMSMLAHRGWDVYLLPRSEPQGTQAADADGTAAELGWQAALEQAVVAGREVADRVVLLGADVGASLALAVSGEVGPLALGLFAPSEPSVLGRRYHDMLGFLDRRRLGKSSGPVAPHGQLARRVFQDGDAAAEPRAFVDDLVGGVSFERPRRHPPAIVFAADNDPLVDSEHSLGFAASEFSKSSSTRLNGHWWPSLGWEGAVDAVHRFLILTLADRVVEFPDEIIGD